MTGGSEAQSLGETPRRRAGTVLGRFVCLFGKWGPGETLTRFSLDMMGANGSVWEEGDPELISLGRRGAERLGGVAWVTEWAPLSGCHSLKP